MIKIYMLLSFVLGLTIQTCTKGCLKCNADNKCLLCDLTENYKMDSDSCTLVDQPNCSQLNLNGDCLSCESGYYLNSSTKKCVVVDTTKLLVNCQDYNSSQSCQNCNNNFVITASLCTAVTIPITNCDVYTTQITCLYCKTGYFVSLDQKSCEAIPPTANCYGFQRYECKTCAGNYILNRNLFFKSSYQTSTDSDKLDTLEDIAARKDEIKILWLENVCQLVTVQNCDELETFSTCKTCSAGYFIKDDKTCQAYPVSVIENCSIYDSNISCSSCNQGFFRVSSTQCQAVASINNCTEYSTTASSSQCTKCNAEFYLPSSSSCVARVVSALLLISNCKTKSINSDKCGECNTGFVLASQGDECGIAVDKCMTHNSFSKGTPPTCSTCNNGFYLLQNVCTAGTDANCLTFTNNGTCSVCKSSFYTDGTNTCTSHLPIPNCSTYSNSIKNTCNFCQNNSYNFRIEKKCKLLTEITNCITYNHDVNATVASCQQCASGFYLSLSNNACTQITLANCASVNSDNPTVCTGCNNGYVLFKSTDGAVITVDCRLPHDFMTAQCDSLVNTGGPNRLNGVTCSNCKLNALTVDYFNQFACIKNEYLKDDSIALLEAKVISGCLKYEDTTSSPPLCRMCENGKFLHKLKTSCVTTCNTVDNIGQYYPLKLENNNGFTYVKYYNYCADPDINFSIWGPGIHSLNSQIDLRCLPNKPNVVSLTLDTTVISPYSNLNPDGTFGNWISNLGTVYPEIEKCPTDYTTINSVTTSTLIPNCQYYVELESSTSLGCLKCSQYFVGKPTANGKFIESCTTMQDCNNTVTYGMIHPYWAKFFSCHKCNDNKIPYLLYVSNGAGANKIQFGTYAQVILGNTNADWANTVTSLTSNNVITCLENQNKATFRGQLNADIATISDAKIEFVQNCGLGLFDLSSTLKSVFNSAQIKNTNTDYTANPSTTYCASCAPGYAPTFRDKATVIACTVIANCTNSTWFNACSQCDTGYVFGYNNDGIVYSSCVAYLVDNNCFAATANNTPCSLCKKGYVKNYDGYCVSMNSPKCQEGKFSQYYETDKVNNLGYLLWYSEQGAGCNACEAGYTAILQNDNIFNRLSCAASSYVTANLNAFPLKQDNSKSLFINNCESYQVLALSNNPVCAKCNANYVLRANNSECITVSNCAKGANVGNSCFVCKDGFGLVTGGNCIAGLTPNCKTYNTSTMLTAVTCITCSSGYYLTLNKTCEKGNVSNCSELSSIDTCDTCQTGYVKITKSQFNANSNDYCYKIDESLNCGVANVVTDNIGAKFTCTTCSVPYSVLQTPAPATDIQTVCLNFNLIENCETYNLGPSLVSSTFLCSSCKAGYFIKDKGFNCSFRTVTPLLCKTLQVDADVCQVCNDGYFLSTNKKECIIFPSGVIGCTTYSNNTTCTGCGVNTWLNGGVCTPILVADKVANCALYSNATTCTTCQNGFVLEGNTCVAMNVSNCAKVASKDVCETCIEGFRLKTTGNQTTCESLIKPNCKIFDQNGSNPCKQCNQNYYINSIGECSTVTPIINSCLVNDTQTTCKVCAKGFALAKDSKSCVDSSIFDSNCAEAFMPENMSCSICSPGYYFKDNVCTAFTGKTFASGCFSQNVDDATICQVCNTGYYMNSSLNCIKNDPIIPPQPPVQDSVQNYKAFLMMLVSVIFLI